MTAFGGTRQRPSRHVLPEISEVVGAALGSEVLALRGLHDEHGIHVALAPHSSVLLDTFSDRPEDVRVTERKEGEDSSVRLTDLCEPEWLANFRLGNLYGSGFGRQDVLSGGGE